MTAGELYEWLMSVLRDHGPNVIVSGDDDSDQFTAYDPVTYSPVATTREVQP